MKPSVIITGATSGLGQSLAKVFANNNYNLIITGRNNIQLTELKNELSKKVLVSAISGDICDSNVINQLFKESKEYNLEILINNAATYSTGKITNLNSKDFEGVVMTNLIAPMLLTQKVYPIFAFKKTGTIINIGSIDALYPKGLQTSYSASKYGLRGFTESLKFEAKDDGIRVLGVYLGGMKTSMNTKQGRDVSKCMETQEVANMIFNASRRNLTAGIDELVINRQNY
jgi:short-subunit dehydrogenase